MKLLKLMLLITLAFGLCGFDGQPSEERQAQDQLPKAQDQMWQLLSHSKIHYDEQKRHYTADFPTTVKQLDDRPQTISGFMLPLEPTEKFRHFILSKRTPTCGFCLPGEPNEIIEVWLKKPVAWDDGLVKVHGRFLLTDNQEMGIFFQIKDGELQ